MSRSNANRRSNIIEKGNQMMEYINRESVKVPRPNGASAEEEKDQGSRRESSLIPIGRIRQEVEGASPSYE